MKVRWLSGTALASEPGDTGFKTKHELQEPFDRALILITKSPGEELKPLVRWLLMLAYTCFPSSRVKYKILLHVLPNSDKNLLTLLRGAKISIYQICCFCHRT